MGKARIINCSCGDEIRIYYDVPNAELKLVDLPGTKKDFYEWRCKNCGQRFHEEAEKPIILTNA